MPLWLRDFGFDCGEILLGYIVRRVPLRYNTKVLMFITAFQPEIRSVQGKTERRLEERIWKDLQIED